MPDWFLVLTLIFLGLIFMLAEILIIPGFGLMGLLGLLCLGVACYVAYTKLSLAIAIILSIVSLLIIALMLILLPRTEFWKKLRLGLKQTKKAGFVAPRKELEKLIGKEGKSLTPLRPSGTALIDGKRVDVVTDGVFVEKDISIKVVKIEGVRVVVRRRD